MGNSPDEQDSSLKEEDTQDPQQTGEGGSEETKEKQEDQAVQESAKEPALLPGWAL